MVSRQALARVVSVVVAAIMVAIILRHTPEWVDHVLVAFFAGVCVVLLILWDDRRG